MDDFRKCCGGERGRKHRSGCKEGPASYDYILRHYNLAFNEGDRVRHTVTNKRGEVRPEMPGVGHYVQVRFFGQRVPMPCHPEELEQLIREEDCPGHVAADDDAKFCGNCGVHIDELH